MHRQAKRKRRRGTEEAAWLRRRHGNRESGTTARSHTQQRRSGRSSSPSGGANDLRRRIPDLPPEPRRGRSPSAPMETSFTPLLAMKSSALLTLEILWTLILPRSGLARRSPGCGDGGGKKMGVRIFFTMTFYAFKVPSRAKSHSRSSPEMTSSSSMSFSPSLKSSSMLSICVPAFLRWELHQAVNVCRQTGRKERVRGCLQTHFFEHQIFKND